MSDRYALLFMKDKPADFPLREIINAFTSAGLSLVYPGTDLVKVLKETGDQSDVSQYSFCELLKGRQLTSFQWWWNDDEDVYCKVSFDADFTKVLLGLDGQNDQQLGLLIGCLKDIYQWLAQQGRAIGLVVDLDRGERGETTYSYNWSKILKGEDVIPGDYPDLVIVPYEIGKQLFLCVGNSMHITQVDGHLMVAR